MIDIRPHAALAHRNHGWLDTCYHFSFSDYHDPDRMGWGRLRVWNDDRIAAKSGFPPHPHSNMEIVTFVHSGAISHRDSLGNEGRTVAGDVQVMSAGTGITHAEYNLEDEDTTLFQLWILPDRAGEQPSWGTRAFPRHDRSGEWVVLASGAPDVDDALPIRADAKVMAATLEAGQTATYTADPARHQYLVPVDGNVRVNGALLSARDGAAITGENEIEVEAIDGAELVLVDTL
ncbi:pirin family protein [Tsuneonella mangrovi]|uniref:pirin family protein n=1 Tax=Tsuneonella mangrovi TaxID=1982042 RepID=UPI000BA1DE8F|nr:pirin family protein [Tsuneonella mangrovi]